METLSKVPPKRRRKRPATTDTGPGTNPHDRFARKTMGDPVIAGDVLRNYTDPVLAKYVDLDHLKPEPTQNFGKEFKEYFKDIAFASHLIDKKGRSEVLIIADHKVTPEPFVILQLAVYLMLSWYKRWCDAGRPQSTKKFRLPVPILVVLYNGKADWKGELNIKDLVAAFPPDLEQFIPTVKVLLIRLNRFNVAHLPGKPETQAVVESMIRATDGTFAAGLESVIGRFKGATLDDRIRDLIADIVHYCDRVEEIDPAQVDRVIQNVIKGQEGIRMSQAIHKSIWATGWESGKAEGWTEGRTEGEVVGGARTIIRFLSRRFKAIPKSLEKKIFTIKDIDQLAELTDRAADCQSLDEFAKALKPQKK